MSERAVTSCSNLYRRMLCPGSAHAELGQPESKSKASEVGVLLHYKDAFGEEGDTVTQHEILERNGRLREESMRNSLRRLNIPEDVHPMIIREQEYSVQDYEGNDIIPGHPDLIYWYPDYAALFVWDSKFGRKLVPSAESNYQLRGYIVSLCDPDYGDFAEAERIFGGITQPFAKPSMHAVWYEPADVVKSKRELNDIYLGTLSPDAPRRPSLEACWFCRARATCPEGNALLQGLSRLKISEVPIDKLEAMADTVANVEGIANDYWERLEYIATKFPHLLNKFEMGPGRKFTNVVDVQSAMERLTDGLIMHHEFYECCKISVPRLIEVVATRLRISSEDAKIKVEALLEGCIETGVGKPILREKNIIELLPNPPNEPNTNG